MRVYVLPILAVLFAGCAARMGIDDLPKSCEDVDFVKIEKRCSDPARANWNQAVKFEYAFWTGDTVLDNIHRSVLVALRHEGYSVIIDDATGNTIIGVRGTWTNDVRSIAGAYFKKIDDACHIYVKIETEKDIPGSWRSNRAQEICMSICRQLRGNRPCGVLIEPVSPDPK